MVGKYFTKFPAVTYNGTIAKNILARAKVTDKAKQGGTTFYNYTLPEEKRADTISNSYYDNYDYMWLIWLANEIIDPYHGYYTSENDFNKYIAKKYGSLDAAYNKIHSWIHNWTQDDRELNPAQYEALPGYLKKYWVGISSNAYSSPNKYIRARATTSVSTNRQAFITDPNADDYVAGDDYEGLDVQGNKYFAVVEKAGGGVVVIRDVVGTISGDEYVKLTGAILDVKSIPATEAAYWTPMTAYELEATVNAAKRNIKLIDKQVAYRIEKDLKRTLNQ